MPNKILSFLILPITTTLVIQADDAFLQDPFGDDIFKEMMHMQRNMDKMFERMNSRMQQRISSQISPVVAYKVKQTSKFVDKGNHYEFVTNIPKSKENKIDISTENGTMSMVSQVIQKRETKTSNGYSSSSSMHMYQQSVTLPADAEDSDINMKYINDKLVISIGKKHNVTKIENHKVDTNSSDKK